MYVITGATGNTGKIIASKLRNAGKLAYKTTGKIINTGRKKAAFVSTDFLTSDASAVFEKLDF